jgi:hypothetical protein
MGKVVAGNPAVANAMAPSPCGVQLLNKPARLPLVNKPAEAKPRARKKSRRERVFVVIDTRFILCLPTRKLDWFSVSFQT